MASPRVVPATIYHRTPDTMLWVQSLIESYKAIPNLMPLIANSSSLLNMARTWNGEEFLRSEADYIFLVDTDMAWPAQSLIRLIRTAKETKAKIVSGFTFVQRGGVIYPHAMGLVGDVYRPMATLPSMEEPFEVDAVGGACLLVHREVYEKVRTMTEGTTAYYWQEEVFNPATGKLRGEDVVFCDRAKAAGFSILYDPRAVFMHLDKMAYISVKEYLDGLPRLLEHANVHPADV